MSSYSTERRFSPRYKAKLDVKLLFKASPQASKATIRSLGDGLTMVGSTHNISETGVGLVVSARNIDRYLMSPEYIVLMELKLPTGPISFSVSPARHERFTLGKAANAYFIGAHITKISDADKQSLISYLNSLR